MTDILHKIVGGKKKEKELVKQPNPDNISKFKNNFRNIPKVKKKHEKPKSKCITTKKSTSRKLNQAKPNLKITAFFKPTRDTVEPGWELNNKGGGGGEGLARLGSGGGVDMGSSKLDSSRTKDYGSQSWNFENHHC